MTEEDILKAYDDVSWITHSKRPDSRYILLHKSKMKVNGKWVDALSYRGSLKDGEKVLYTRAVSDFGNFSLWEKED